MRNYLFLAAALLGLWSCDVLGPQVSKADQYQLRATYYQGACFGRCPIYTLDLYENGLLVYKGGQFADKQGTWQRSIDRRQATALIDSFRRADFPNYPLAFRSELVDLPSREVTFYADNGRAYQTNYKENAPDELKALSAAMRRLAELGDYRPVSDTIPTITQRLAGPAKRQELIVQLIDGVDVPAWTVRYRRNGLEYVRKISPSGPYHLLSVDPSVTPVEKMLETLRTDENVQSAQLNREVGIR